EVWLRSGRLHGLARTIQQERGASMGLRDTYNAAIQTAKGLHMEGAAEERDGKLYFHGTVQSQEEANKIWDAIKTIPTWRSDIVADIKPLNAGTASAAAP